MPHVYPARTADISLTIGLGPISVSGIAPEENMRTFSEVLVVGDSVYLGVAHREKDEWEEGVYTYIGTDRFARANILQSSNDGAPVRFSAGIKDVWVTTPARTVQRADENILRSGIVEIDFGIAGAASTSVTVADETITSAPFLSAQIVAIATEDHTVADHQTDAPIIVAGDVVEGTSFTIFAVARGANLTGRYSVSWMWK